MREDAILCYVDEPWAYFTTKELSKQWGDDWNDAPYEHNAGSPYEWREGRLVDEEPESFYEVFRVAYDGNLAPPCYNCCNSPYSVEQINAGATAWLRTDYGTPIIVIPAGTIFPEFVRLVYEAKGHVYVPIETT